MAGACEALTLFLAVTTEAKMEGCCSTLLCFQSAKNCSLGFDSNIMTLTDWLIT